MTGDWDDNVQPLWDAPDPPEHKATPAEAMSEYGDNAAWDRPDVQWILTPWDVWVHNPHVPRAATTTS